MYKRLRRSSWRRGFTLLEVMLVLLILVVIGSVATVAVLRMQRNAYIRAAKVQVTAFKTPLLSYRLDIGDFPPSSEGLQSLRTLPSGLSSPTKWLGPYLDTEVPRDPWGNEFRYEYPGKNQADMPDIWSYGPDQIDGTEDDIGNWPTLEE